MEKLMLIDANSLLYRAFFALPPLENKAGQPTGAVYGLINMLMKLLEEYPVDYAVAAFDLSGPTKRSEEYEEYKANRPPTPFELRSQMQIAREVLVAMGISYVELPGYEADDLVGTIARMAAQNDCFSWIVTGDKDILQLVNENTQVILTQRGISQTKTYNPEAVLERYQVSPPQIVDIKGLMGDTSDNIPGVPGIGEKTAIKLISQYESVDGVYQNIGQLKGKMRERLEKNKQQAELSRSLAQIDAASPTDFSWPPAKLERDDEKLYNLFKELGFNTLLQRLDLVSESSIQLEVVRDAAQVDDFSTQPLAVLLLDDALAVGEKEKSFLYQGEAYAAACTKLEQALTQEGQIITDDAKRLFRFAMEQEVSLQAEIQSCQLGAYLLKPGSKLDLPTLVRAWTDTGLDQGEQSEIEHLATHASLLPDLWQKLEAELRATRVWDLYVQVELPLSRVLARMEKTGIAVDIRELEQIGAQLEGQIDSLEADIHDLAGSEFNINSPKQLGKVLFEDLEIPPLRKTKTGYSTDASVLEAIQDKHPVVELILQYRQLVKLQNTYIVGLTEVWNEQSGRIYTTFQQMVTATGRLSSSDPNLQNIPIRMEEGRRVRKAFVAGGGYQHLLAADYSQIELRVLAHIAQDETLIEAFRQGQDIHNRTAAEIFGLELEEVTSSQRRAAKAVNFGLVYGQTDFGLAKSLGISKTQAAEYIEAYFKRYPGVKAYMDDISAQAKRDGYVSTIFSRRRYLPEINSRNYQRRSFAQRTAINSPIQGTAADIIKLAMVEVEKRLDSQGLVSRMLLQVHDELVLETSSEELKRVAILVGQAMENVVDLDVPLVVDVKHGSNWYNMGPIED